MSWIVDQTKDMTAEQLRSRVIFYYSAAVATESQIEEMCAEALGYPHDEQYGWVTGDHVGLTLVAELCRKYRELEDKTQALLEDLKFAEDEARDLYRELDRAERELHTRDFY